jgi:hypothetical protein
MKAVWRTFVLFTMASTWLLAQTPQASAQAKKLTFGVDVAEDFTQFVFTPVHSTDVIPLRGSMFLTVGNVFPEGTIVGDGHDFDPNSSGSIGTWVCNGVMLVDADQIPDAPIWVDTRQRFKLPDDSKSLTTDGFEGTAVQLRTVTGGTGELQGYIGQEQQEFLGFNIVGGVNLRITFTLTKPGGK